MLGTPAAVAAGAVTASALPATPSVAFVPDGRPVLTHGVQSGDAFGGAANIWHRAARSG
ncbi:hypothetical protein [Dactylosporangium sp. NPDC000521]|uniref:hypothetical protein n=1 Tax=Dactylosporangium sp. NPDC000521 TaxID=3363975 RepID=UPI0036AE85A1